MATTTSETSTTRMVRSPIARRFAALVALVAAGSLDYVTGADAASAPFYIPVLLGFAFVEPLLVCLAFSVLAAGISLGTDLLCEPARIVSASPYKSAIAHLMGFALISGATSILVRGRRRLRASERLLHDKAVEWQERTRRLEDALREATRLRVDLTGKERHAAISYATFAAAYEMQRPLASASVYVEELARLMQRASRLGDAQLVLDEMPPLLEKLQERIQRMERMLEEIRDLHKS